MLMVVLSFFSIIAHAEVHQVTNEHCANHQHQSPPSWLEAKKQQQRQDAANQHHQAVFHRHTLKFTGGVSVLLQMEMENSSIQVNE